MYIFLDVDGVLNKESDWKKPYTINESCLYQFATLMKSIKEPHIILSSTWRVGYTNTGAVAEHGNGLSSKLAEYCLRIEDSTPVSNKTRQEEIEYYIRRHGISSYIVLDDDESLFPYPERINLYLTNYKTGITESDIRKLKKICKGR